MMAALLFASVACVQDTARLTLAAAVERALASHPSVALARAQHDRAAAELGEASATRFPQVSLDASVNRFQEPMVVAPLHGFDPRNPPLFDRTLVQSGLSMSWTVFDFGSRSAYVNAERSLVDASAVGRSAAESQLIAETVSAFLDVSAARQTLSAEDLRLAAIRAEANRVALVLEQGKAARVDVLRADVELKRAQADRLTAASRVETREHRLADLMGTPFAAVHNVAIGRLALADTASPPEPGDPRIGELFNRARLTNPEVRRSEMQWRSARTAVSAIRATGRPELRLGSQVVDRGRAQGDFQAEWQVGLAMNYRIYGGGSHAASVSKAEADERIAAEQLRLAQLRVNQQIDRALTALREARARTAALQGAVDAGTEVSRIERLALDVGSGTQTDYLQSEASLLRTRADLIEARHAEIAARVELARVLGELSPQWLTRTLEASP